MPCNQVRETTLDIKAANLDVMTRALEALGMTTHREADVIRVVTREGVSGYYTAGRLVLNGVSRLDQATVQREYSTQSIISTAKRQGWQLRFQSDGRIEATRRRFA